MPQVYRQGAIPAGTPDVVLVDRTTRWGNPYHIGRDGTREDVINKFEAWVRSNPFFVADVHAMLRGKNLVCHCVPLPCHAEVLLRIANEDLPD